MIENQDIPENEVIELVPFQMEQLSFVDIEPGDSLNRGIKEIPDQLEYKIGHVAELVGVKPYVLRFWESEFDALKPKKSKKGQRVYSKRDVETALIIRKLLYEDRFSIEGAKTKIRELRSKVKEEKKLSGMLEEVKEATTAVVTNATGQLEEMLEEIQEFRLAFL